jgi:hypothetical protein
MPFTPVRYVPRVGSLVSASVRLAAADGLTAAVPGVGVAAADEQAAATRATPTVEPIIEIQRDF